MQPTATTIILGGGGALVVLTTSILAFVAARKAEVLLQTPHLENEVLPAGCWIRAAALCVDCLLMSIFTAVLVTFTGLLEANRIGDGYDWPIAFGVGIFFLIGYFTLPYAYGEQTYGKYLAGIAVERLSGNSMGVGRSLLRAIALLSFSLCCLLTLVNTLVVALTPRKQALHDFLADTRVRHLRSPNYLIFASLLLVLGALLLLHGVVRPYVLQTVFVPSGGMLPALQQTDKLIVNKLYYRFSPLQRGDIVVFSATRAMLSAAALHSSENMIAVKRVIGLPGETIAIRHHIGIFINGKLIKDAQQMPDYDWPEATAANPSPQPYHLAKDECFVLGDNRRNSLDSHLLFDPATHRLAPGIPLKNILGRATLRFSPLERFGLLK